MKDNVYFFSGIDTDAGKSYVTGYWAKCLMEQGVKVITQKLVQTGNHDVSEDIELHRRIMGIPFTPEDEQKLTMPEIYSYPCSCLHLLCIRVVICLLMPHICILGVHSKKLTMRSLLYDLTVLKHINTVCHCCT